MRFVATTKARTGMRKMAAKPATWRYEALHRAADRGAPALRRVFRDAVNDFRNKIDLGALTKALADGRMELVYTVIDWSMLEVAREPFTKALSAVARAAGRASAKQTTHRQIQKADEQDTRTIIELIFNSEAPEAELWARQNSGVLIQGITDESLGSVRETIATYLRTGEDYGKGAQKIKDAVGLTRQQAGALARYRDSLGEQGAPPARVDRLTESYRERLLKYRAETISRTETIKASNKGAMLYWQQLIGTGAIARGDARKVWIVTPDDRLCPVCEPLGGESVGIDDQFSTSIGSVDAPPLHPNCRCAISLEIAP